VYGYQFEKELIAMANALVFEIIRFDSRVLCDSLTDSVVQVKVNESQISN
jgi:hypothetical protein